MEFAPAASASGSTGLQQGDGVLMQAQLAAVWKDFQGSFARLQAGMLASQASQKSAGAEVKKLQLELHKARMCNINMKTGLEGQLKALKEVCKEQIATQNRLATELVQLKKSTQESNSCTCVQVTDETLRQTQALKDDLQLLHTAQDRLQQLWERQSHKQEDVLTAKAKLVQDLNTSILETDAVVARLNAKISEMDALLSEKDTVISKVTALPMQMDVVNADLQKPSLVADQELKTAVQQLKAAEQQLADSEFKQKEAETRLAGQELINEEDKKGQAHLKKQLTKLQKEKEVWRKEKEAAWLGSAMGYPSVPTRPLAANKTLLLSKAVGDIGIGPQLSKYQTQAFLKVDNSPRP